MRKNSGLTKVLVVVGAVATAVAAVAGAFAIYKKYFAKKEELEYEFSETFEDEEVVDEEATAEE